MKAKENHNQKNVIIYCRVSTDEQRKGTSVEVQEERLREYCKRMGYNIIELPNFKEDESAKTFKKTSCNAVHTKVYKEPQERSR